MIKAPKISINIPPFNNCRGEKSSNVAVTDQNKASTGITKIISPIENTSNIVRRHSFRNGNTPSNVTVHTTSFTNVPQMHSIEGTIEQAILRSNVPINVNEKEEITVLGQKGFWTNRSEVLNWNGPVPISQYKLNDDPHPEVIHKTNSQPVEYTQDIQVRYLRPPTPPAPGELIIKQESSHVQLPAAPPQIIRQHAPRPQTPEPLIIREAPPELPAHIPRKVITISGHNSEAPLRKVIIEKLPPLPPKPQSVIIERWLPYQQQKRRVIYESSQRDVHFENPRNLIIQWESLQPVVKKSVENAEPRDYVSKYGHTLRRTTELPSFVRELESDGANTFKRTAHEQTSNRHELEGDIEAFKYLDISTIEREGLQMYRHYLNGNRESNYTASVLNSSNEYNQSGSHSIGITHNNDSHLSNVHEHAHW